jgi:predicted transglutaminase-like cysteine proteinase
MSWIFKSFLAAGIACAGAAAKADTIVEAPATAGVGSFISEYDNALAPLQAVKFCMNYGAECEPDAVADQQALPSGERARDMLREVNRAVNDAITPTKKPTSPLLAHWTVSPDAGDCNDYAVTKRHRLIEMGWPKSALRLAVVLTGSGQGHLVLVARLSEGDVVLDNLSSSIRSWNTAGYQWISMQSASNPRFWVAVGEHGQHLRASRLASLRTPS